MKIKTMTLALGACAAAIPVGLVAAPATGQWEIGPNVRGRNYSVGMPAQPSQGPGGSVAFDFPVQGRGQVDALTTRVGPLADARSITLRYRITAAPGTRFIADEAPAETATISLYFQRAGDNWSGRGHYQSYRWYSPAHAVVPLTPGEHTVAVRFDERWTDVHGAASSDLAEPFQDALNHTEMLGIAFGSSSLRSHGVYATGPARFTLIDLDIS